MTRPGSARYAGLAASLIAVVIASVASAQPPSATEDTRAGLIIALQQEKSEHLKPYEPNKAEIWVKKLEERFLTGDFHWHPFFENAYSGGGFTLGAGYLTHVSGYNTVDIRGSYTIKNYKRLEGEFRAPRLFNRRGTLSLVGGWREATEVGFYGIGTGNTSVDDRANYGFQLPYASAVLDVRPARNWFLLSGGVEYSRWDQRSGSGSAPSVEEVYTPDTLPGLGASPTYVHAQGTAAVDSRPFPGYARTGGYYGVTYHLYSDTDDTYSFGQVDYEAIQHVPLFRDAWVLSLRGKVTTAFANDDQQIPFFMLPSVGGGESLRGFTSWRFRDQNSLLMQAEWRVLVNSFLDTAIFFDAGKVTSRRADIDFQGLKNDFGIGFRMHGPGVTPLRIDLAKSNEGFALIFSGKAAF